MQLIANAASGAIVRFDDPSAAAQFTAMALMTICVVFGTMLFVAGSVTVLTLLRETANGNDPISDWPPFDPVDWFLDSLYMISSATITLMAGAFTGNLFSGLGPSEHLIALTVTWTAAFVFLFPPLLLSTLEGGSPIQFISRPVWRSLRAAGGTWIRFSFLAIVLANAIFAIWHLRRFDTWIGDFFAAAVAVGSLMVFFRLVGRLARVSQHVLAERDQRQLEAAEGA